MIIEKIDSIREKLDELVTGNVKVEVCWQVGDLVAKAIGTIATTPYGYLVFVWAEDGGDASVEFGHRHVARIDDGRDLGKGIEILLRA